MNKRIRGNARYQYIGRINAGYRQAWTARGVDQGTHEENHEAAARMGLKYRCNESTAACNAGANVGVSTIVDTTGLDTGEKVVP